MKYKNAILKIKGIVENTPSPDLDNYCIDDIKAMDESLSNVHGVITELEAVNTSTRKSGLNMPVVSDSVCPECDNKFPDYMFKNKKYICYDCCTEWEK